MRALRGRPSRWRGIIPWPHRANPTTSRGGAKAVAASVSPTVSDPGDEFALGRRAAPCRSRRTKIDARSHSRCGATFTTAKIGDCPVPRPLGIQFKPATQPRRNNISRVSDDRDLEI